ncbi:unnamed protein product [Adineta ricciae]|uniref:BRCT domain-containing protein n=1 Tax=Adineta ricciae TaxID=249248 RepID=A0A815H8P8_ADIRI|nr:unnamed protein product [Adineta ricciae]CAF1639764.1 unnamed protein product [Adineta ricciae]
MTTTDDPYQFSMDDSISSTPRTRSSSRTRKAPTNNTKKPVAKPAQQRIVTRSSQKSPMTSAIDENDHSFMSNIQSGFSQFVNPKKRPRDDKKTKAIKRPKINTENDENQPPDEEIQAIEQVKLIYETSGGRTNLARAAATNAKILANRNPSNARPPTISNTTYTLNDQNHIIDDTQTDTYAIPDTMVDTDMQHNDSSWQRDIDRLMKKLEEPSTSFRSPTQIEETQKDNEEQEEEITAPIYLTQTGKTQLQPIKPISQVHSIPKTMTQPKKTTITQLNEIAIQTDNSQTTSSTHPCCQDVSTCPCVLRYSKLERLFMEKMSRFVSIVPTIPSSDIQPKRRPTQHYSRFRRIRGRRRNNPRLVVPSPPNNESTTVEETSDEATIEKDNQIEETVQLPPPPVETIVPPTPPPVTVTNPIDNILSSTIIKDVTAEPIGDLSTIEKVETTALMDHSSTLLISSSNNTCPTGRRLVLTASSLDETQKSQFRSFISRFNASISSAVDSSTTHVIVNEQSVLVCPLTGKTIQGIARHLFIVSHRWLNECIAQDSIVDERPYEIRGDTSLGFDHGGMRRSRLTPSYLLENYSIFLRCSNSDCAPLQTVEQVQELIELCGAKFIRSFSEIRTIDKQRQILLVLGIHGFNGTDKKRKALLDTCQQFNVRCVNIHWLLISIAKYEVQPVESFDINQE